MLYSYHFNHKDRDLFKKIKSAPIHILSAYRICINYQYLYSFRKNQLAFVCFINHYRIYINYLFNLFSLLFIHLFAFITLLPMPIFDLINTITSKYSQAFSSFLQAYSDIKQMKNIPQNLSIISQCILAEHSQGSSKCLNYYITHEMDKIFLSLNEQTNLESFYLSILPVVTEGYLNSEFFTEAWKYKRYFQLAKLYSERCLSLKIFNLNFANSLIETFPKSEESIVVLCEMDIYLKHFKENNLGAIALEKANSAIKSRNSEIIKLIEFLVYFEDKSSLDLLNMIEFDIPGEQDNRNVCKDIPTHTNVNLNDRIVGYVTVNDSCNSEFAYFFLIFKQIKSVKIRQKILEFLPILVESGFITLEACVEFIIECLKVDSLAVSMSLNHYQDSVWVPLHIQNLILKNCNLSTECNDKNCIGNFETSNENILNPQMTELDDMNCIGTSNSSINSNFQLDSLITEQDSNCDLEKSNIIVFDIPNENKSHPILFKIMKDQSLVDACVKLNNKHVRILKSSKLFDLFLKKIIDLRIFSFLLFVNDTLILNNLEHILNGIENKEEFCLLIWQRLMDD